MNRAVGRRLLWVFLLTICFAVMLVQMTDRVRHYLSEPVAVQVSVARNTSLTYPAITICNKNMFNVSAIQRLRLKHNLTRSNDETEVSSLLQARGMDTGRLWRETMHTRRGMIKECWFGRNLTCDQRGRWSTSYTTMGVCHTFALNDSLVHLAGIFHNLYLKVQERESVFYKDDKGWRFYVHDPRETPTIGVQTHGTSLYPGQGRDLRLDLKKIQALSSSVDPCSQNSSYLQNNCFFDCFMRRLQAANITCKLPYMTGPLPSCSTPEEYRTVDKLSRNLFFYGQWNPNECHCEQQCLKVLFTSSLESTTDRYSAKKGYFDARIRIYYQNLQYEFIKEELGYGPQDLLCDIGGTLSLLMGASLLTCCELLEVAWFSVIQNCCTSASFCRIWSGGGCGGNEEEEKLGSSANCCNRKRSSVGGGNSNENGSTAITIAAPVTAAGNANGDAGTMVSEV